MTYLEEIRLSKFKKNILFNKKMKSLINSTTTIKYLISPRYKKIFQENSRYMHKNEFISRYEYPLNIYLRNIFTQLVSHII